MLGPGGRGDLALLGAGDQLRVALWEATGRDGQVELAMSGAQVPDGGRGENAICILGMYQMVASGAPRKRRSSWQNASSVVPLTCPAQTGRRLELDVGRVSLGVRDRDRRALPRRVHGRLAQRQLGSQTGFRGRRR